jgi:hypothetical protein
MNCQQSSNFSSLYLRQQRSDMFMIDINWSSQLNIGHSQTELYCW